jgi:hypothetical protein
MWRVPRKQHGTDREGQGGRSGRSNTADEGAAVLPPAAKAKTPEARTVFAAIQKRIAAID